MFTCTEVSEELYNGVFGGLLCEAEAGQGEGEDDATQREGLKSLHRLQPR